MDLFGERKGVSLGGRKKAGKSREQVLLEARQLREQRTAAAAPLKAASTLQRLTRGRLARRMLRETVLLEAVRNAVEVAEAHATLAHSHALALSLARRVGLLWAAAEGCLCETAVDLTRRGARVLSSCGGTLECVCGQHAAGTCDARGLLRRMQRLLPAVLYVAGQCGDASAVSLVTALCSPSGGIPQWASCCQGRGAQLARDLLHSAAPSILNALACWLLPPADRHTVASATSGYTSGYTSGGAGGSAPEVSVSLERLGALCRVALDAPSTASSAPALCTSLVQRLPPELLLSMPPPPSARGAVRALFGGLSGAARRHVEASLAAELARPARASGLSIEGQVHEAAAVLLGALIACVDGAGADWRRDGWIEGRPRLLRPEDLSALTSATVERMRQQAQVAGGSTPSSADALLLLLRARWDVVKAVVAWRESRRGGGTEAAAAEAAAAEAAEAGSVAAAEAAEAGSVAAWATEAAVAASSADTEILPDAQPTVCGICFEPPDPPRTLRAMRCGHGFCDECWGGTLMVALEKGPSCVHGTCPQPGCSRPVSGDVWAAALPAEGLQQLSALSLRLFVSCNSLVSQCPNGACGRAAVHLNASTPPELLPCECGTSFCVTCGDPPHWPTSCERKLRWAELLHQSPDAMLIRQTTKPCPSCGVRTTRTMGCMHISCTQCAVEWCWGCGQMGRGVHHVSACSRTPNPSWKYVSEDRKAIDGSLERHLDEFLIRQEQCESIVGWRAPAAALGTAPGSAPGSASGVAPPGEAMSTTTAAGTTSSGMAAAMVKAKARGMTPGALRETLLRALSALRWMQVYLYWCPMDSVPGRLRLAYSKLTLCTEALYEACAFAGGAAAVVPNWERLSSDEAAVQHAWLVSLLLYLRSHLPAGPPDIARAAPPPPPPPVPGAAAWRGGPRAPRGGVRGGNALGFTGAAVNDGDAPFGGGGSGEDDVEEDQHLV